jgi:porin
MNKLPIFNLWMLALLSPASVRAADKETLDSPTPAVAANPYAEKLSGDWGGQRTRLAEHGITFDLESTHYYQSLVSGDGDHGFNYGGRVDALLGADTEKLGLWQGGSIRSHAEFRYDDLQPNLGGTLLPNNTGMKLPLQSDESLEITSLFLSQKIGETASVTLGKINTVDLLAGDSFFGGGGISRFMNLAFVAPPNGLTPPVIMGGIFSLKTAPFDWTLMVFDPDDRTRDYLPDDLFDRGVNLAISGAWSGEIAGRTTRLSATGIYSTKERADLGDLLLPVGLKTGTKDHSFHAGLYFSHFFSEPEPGVGWRVFLRAGGSDGNPNPYASWVTGGVSARGIVPGRPLDTFGAGYFFYHFSNELRSTIAPLGNFDDEQGMEIYYNYAVTPWFHLTGDMQYVNPATGANDHALICGLRARVVF